MRQSVNRPKSGRALITIALIYLAGVILVAVIWQMLGL